MTLPASTDRFTYLIAMKAQAVADGKLSVADAAAQLQRFAVEHGVVDRIGQDHVQRLMSQALKQPRRPPR
jgi:hypothetical protein